MNNKNIIFWIIGIVLLIVIIGPKLGLFSAFYGVNEMSCSWDNVEKLSCTTDTSSFSGDIYTQRSAIYSMSNPRFLGWGVLETIKAQNPEVNTLLSNAGDVCASGASYRFYRISEEEWLKLVNHEPSIWNLVGGVGYDYSSVSPCNSKVVRLSETAVLEKYYSINQPAVISGTIYHGDLNSYSESTSFQTTGKCSLTSATCEVYEPTQVYPEQAITTSSFEINLMAGGSNISSVPGDTNGDGIISRQELGVVINNWAEGTVSRNDLGNAVQLWSGG